MERPAKRACERERRISGIYVTTASVYSLHFFPSTGTATAIAIAIAKHIAYTYLSSLYCKAYVYANPSPWHIGFQFSVVWQFLQVLDIIAAY